MRFFLPVTPPTLALGPTHTPIQWVLGNLTPGVKRPGHKADHSLPCSNELEECDELYLHAAIHFHDAVLS
jgi:hypothetical protein